MSLQNNIDESSTFTRSVDAIEADAFEDISKCIQANPVHSNEILTLSEEVDETDSSMVSKTENMLEEVVSLPNSQKRIVHNQSDLLKNFWSGYVKFIDVDKRSFCAELTDILLDEETIEVEFDFDDLYMQDLTELKPGSLISWKIGTRYYSTQEQENFEKIYIEKQAYVNTCSFD